MKTKARHQGRLPDGERLLHPAEGVGEGTVPGLSSGPTDSVDWRVNMHAGVSRYGAGESEGRPAATGGVLAAPLGVVAQQ